jgi:hypothetical protein
MSSVEILDVGDKVKHPKFGTGTVILRQGDTEDQKVYVKFGGEVGEKRLMVKFAKMKKIQERPTLSATPAAEPAAAPVAAVRRKTLVEDEAEEEVAELEDVAADDDEDAEEEADEE